MSQQASEDKYNAGNKKNLIQGFIIGLAVVVAAVIAVFYFVIGVSTVDGNSMVPTLTNGQTLVFYRLENNYKYGDIVKVDMPSGDYYVKRVIGVAGDEIDIKDGKVILNGEVLDEPYIQGKTQANGEIVHYPLTVSEGKVFVLGDNREHSVDSRELGEVSLIMISGKILGQ